ncbi:hypothetical protein [Thalassolituus sp.]|uniref:hypothetical protein n=1 Tax=Thalassolituus sp. TaxID=2030822 RepID=UPI00243F9AC9|nr:hypothetical protein [Thalassolituus sp.]|tara:strand:+ start:91 stop:477 length:387 start_codon:yes stop_codon:yes gene_type:complete
MEKNLEEWKELRARVDSIAGAIFLVAGGALSLSITVVIGNLGNLGLSDSDANVLKYAWTLLVLSIVLALSVKIVSVLQKYLLLIKPSFMNQHYMKFNGVGWVLGLTSFVFFCGGLWLLAISASDIIGS